MKKILHVVAVVGLSLVFFTFGAGAQEFYIIGGGGGSPSVGGNGGYTGVYPDIANNGGGGQSTGPGGGGGGGYIGDGSATWNGNGADSDGVSPGAGGAGFGGGQNGQNGTMTAGGNGGNAVYNGDLHKDIIIVASGNMNGRDPGTSGAGGNATLNSYNITGELYIIAGLGSTASVNVNNYGTDANSGYIGVYSGVPYFAGWPGGAGAAFLNAGKIYASSVTVDSTMGGSAVLTADYMQTSSYDINGDPEQIGVLKSYIDLLDVTGLNTTVNMSDTNIYNPLTDNGVFFKNIFIGGGDTLKILNAATNMQSFGFERINILGANATLNSDKGINVAPNQTLEFQTKAEYWNSQYVMLNNTGASINIEDNSSVKVNVTGSRLNVGDSITLIGGDATGTDGQILGFGGATLVYDLDLTYASLTATVTDGSGGGQGGGSTGPVDPGSPGNGSGGGSGGAGQVNPQATAFAEGGAAVMALLSDGSDLAAAWGIANAVSMTQYTYDLAVFGAINYSNAKYETGSHIDVKGISVLGGIAKKFVFEPGAFTAGLFIEYGSAGFDSENTFENFSDVKGSGDADYIGGGLLGRYDFNKNEAGRSYWYAEGSLRIGSAKNDFEANNIGAIDFVKYDADALYYGLHLGLGRIFMLSEKINIDGYGKYFFVHQNGKDAELSTSEPLKFDGINSHRLRGGARGSYKINEVWSPYLGLAAEYELDGKVNAEVYGMPLDEVKLMGFRGIGEVGLTVEIGSFGADFGVRGFAGEKEGFDGSLRLIYFFGKRSITKEPKPEPAPLPEPKPVPVPEPVFVLTSADAGQNFFEFDSYELTQHDRDLIAELAQKYAKEPRLIRMRVEGHTDHIGTEEYNDVLSKNRAQAVANVLIENGIPAHKIEVRGFGKSRPIADESPEGMKKNRRVEIFADVEKQQNSGR